MDNAKNFAKVVVSIGYDAVATSIVLSSGHGAKLPTVPFNLVWWNSTDYPDPSDDPNVEIVRCTARATDTLTVTRAQESTAASTKNTASKVYKMIAGLTAKVINTDLTLAPETAFKFEDEFMGRFQDIGWTVQSGTDTSLSGDGNHIGIAEAGTGATINSLLRFEYRQTVANGYGDLHAKIWTLKWVLKVVQTTQQKFRIGLINSSDVTLTTPDGYYFEIDATVAASTWKAATANGGTPTNTDTALTQDTGYHTFQISSDGAGNITFYIDGVLKATNTATLSVSTSLRFIVCGTNKEAVTKLVDSDYLGFLVTVTR